MKEEIVIADPYPWCDDEVYNHTSNLIYLTPRVTSAEILWEDYIKTVDPNLWNSLYEKIGIQSNHYYSQESEQSDNPQDRKPSRQRLELF